jgi:hypothetical protein
MGSKAQHHTVYEDERAIALVDASGWCEARDPAVPGADPPGGSMLM